MKKFIDNNGNEVDASYTLTSISGFSGIVVESWGPKTRNPEYAKAVNLLISRLRQLSVANLRVFVVSRQLEKAYPDILDREINIDSKLPVNIGFGTDDEVRLNIGRKVAALKATSTSTKGGNMYKRILLHHPLITEKLWKQLAVGQTDDTKDISEVIDLIFEPEILDTISEELALYVNFPPKGNLKPQKIDGNTIQFARDPLVKAWVLKNSNGACELCRQPAPFISSNGKPFLEVHHVKRLADQGPDCINNTVAVCPNCHRALHLAINSHSLVELLYSQISRLVR